MLEISVTAQCCDCLKKQTFSMEIAVGIGTVILKGQPYPPGWSIVNKERAEALGTFDPGVVCEECLAERVNDRD